MAWSSKISWQVALAWTWQLITIERAIANQRPFWRTFEQNLNIIKLMYLLKTVIGTYRDRALQSRCQYLHVSNRKAPTAKRLGPFYQIYKVLLFNTCADQPHPTSVMGIAFEFISSANCLFDFFIDKAEFNFDLSAFRIRLFDLICGDDFSQLINCG